MGGPSADKFAIFQSLAIDHVNAHILPPNVTIQLVFNDSMLSPTIGNDRFTPPLLTRPSSQCSLQSAVESHGVSVTLCPVSLTLSLSRLSRTRR